MALRKIDPADLSFARLSSGLNLSSFICGNSDLDDFLHNEALFYQADLMAVTYVVSEKAAPVAFFTLLNDKITPESEGTTAYNRASRKVPVEKRKHKSFPAVKLARLGVRNDMKGRQIGHTIMDFLKASFSGKNKTGCRFITVDSYRDALGFYERNGFKLFSPSDIDNPELDTVSLFYDLRVLISA